ncbi:UDP-N-acetylmuramoyl-L-alanine--D-glutamate ligase, partial [Enterorhabdus sp. NM05_H27]
CYNDSKATNVDATLVALRAFLPARPIVLLGGRDKGTDLAPLVAACEEHAKAVVCFGEARERFAAAFADAALPIFGAPALEAALDAALAAAEPGDVVVLSPACASFDEFSCFEERGDVFKALVAARAAAEEG